MEVPGMIRRLRVTKARAVTQSIVEKGAAENTDAFMLQAAPALVDDTVAQGVAEELNEVRGRDGGWDVWCAFQEALGEAQTAADVEAAIDELPALLKSELMAAGDNDGDEPVGMTTEGATMTQESPEQPTENAQTPEAEAVTQDAPETPETPAAITQSDVEALIQSALAPLADKLTTTETSLTEANAVIEQQKTEIAQLKSKTTPASRQPDAEPGTTVVTQSQPDANPYANSGIDFYLKQHFPTQRS